LESLFPRSVRSQHEGRGACAQTKGRSGLRTPETPRGHQLRSCAAVGISNLAAPCGRHVSSLVVRSGPRSARRGRPASIIGPLPLSLTIHLTRQACFGSAVRRRSARTRVECVGPPSGLLDLGRTLKVRVMRRHSILRSGVGRYRLWSGIHSNPRCWRPPPSAAGEIERGPGAGAT